MATVVSHLAVPLALTMAIGSGLVPHQLTTLAVICSVLPDLDALGLWVGVPYAHPLGHRGITHSLPFSAAVAGFGFAFASQLGCQPWVTFFVLLVSTASHGLLDALTNGGLGIAFFSPFSNRRYFLPWRILEVSPLGLSAFLSHRGLSVLMSEVRYVWFPCLLVGFVGIAVRRLYGGA